MPREKQLLFTCKECSKPVYREGKSTNFAEELCGFCNIKPTVDPCSNIIKKDDPDEHILKTTSIAKHILAHTDVLSSLTVYRYRLDRVESLSKLHPELNFAELWCQVKGGN